MEKSEQIQITVEHPQSLYQRNKDDYSWIPGKNSNFLLALTQNALDKYAPELAEDGVVMIDESLSAPAFLDSERVVSVPILRCARETVGKTITANIVAVGAINELFGLFDEENLREAVSRHIPAGTEDLNFRALSAGKALIGSELRDKYLVEREN